MGAGSRRRTKEAPPEGRAEARIGFRQAVHQELEGLRRNQEGPRAEGRSRLLGGGADGVGAVGAGGAGGGADREARVAEDS